VNNPKHATHSERVGSIIDRPVTISECRRPQATTGGRDWTPKLKDGQGCGIYLGFLEEEIYVLFIFA
jgi:hypothetical protein